MTVPAAESQSFFAGLLDNPVALALAVVIVGVGLLVGLRDVLRLSATRIFAVAAVAFRESVRRKVLWVTPLAMLGVLGISQFVRSADLADDLRQITKYCYFASGLTVVLMAVILSCTNLPRDIDSKVIFTVVTKPATRLELILGKIAGFAATSAAVLGLMGLFTVGYLGTRAFMAQRVIAAELETGRADPSRRAALEHYQSIGLLTARGLVGSDDLQFYAELPEEDEAIRVMYGGVQNMIAPFEVSRATFIAPDLFDANNELKPGVDADQAIGRSGVSIAIKFGYERFRDPEFRGPYAAPRNEVGAVVSILDEFGYDLIQSRALAENGRLVNGDPTGQSTLFVPLTVGQVAKLIPDGWGRTKRFFVQVTPTSGDFLYNVPPDAIQLAVALSDGTSARLVPPTFDEERDVRPRGPIFRSRLGNYGLNLLGPDEVPDQQAVYLFRDVGNYEVIDGQIPFEMDVGVEVAGYDESDLTTLEIRLRNRATGELSPTIDVYPENNRTLFFTAPATSITGGDFDLIVRNKSAGHYVGLQDDSVRLVSGRQPFAWNLLKGLGVLWLLAVLVVTIGVFTSTLVSAPIAVVLTLCLLLGRWAADQVAGSLNSRLGRDVAQQIFPTNASEAQVVSTTVDALRRTLEFVTSVLPDVGNFGVGGVVERGLIVPLGTYGPALFTLLAFGLPLVMLGYLVLRNKEVAP